MTASSDFMERRRLEQEARVASTRYRKLQAVTDVLLRHMDLDELLPELLEAVRQAVGSDSATLLLPTPDGKNLAIRGTVGEEEGVIGEVRVPLGKGVAGKIAAERTPRIVPDLRKANPHSEFLRRKLHSLIGVPLIISDDMVGVVHAGTFQPHEFTEEDLTLMQLVAERAAVAIQNARLYEAERVARSDAEVAQVRLAFLAEATAIMSRSLQMPQALESLGRLAVTFLTDLCLIDVLTEGGGVRRMVAVHADAEKQPLAELLRTRFAPDPEGPHPAVHVMTTGRSEFSPEMPVDFLRSTTRDEEHFRIVRELGFQSYMCVPLLSRGRVLGCFTLVSTHPNRRYGPADVELAEELARRAALAVDNALLYQGEQEARRSAEQAADRLAFLADANEVLSSSLDHQVLLQKIATLAVLRLADWCVIDVLTNDDSIKQVALAHRDPSKEALIRELRTRYPPQKDRPHPVSQVLRSGEPLLATEVTREELAGRAQDARHLTLLTELGIRSHIVVPLTARGRILGALSLICGETDRRYGREDLLLAVDLGRRAGIAVDTTRLYERQRHIARTLQRSLLPPSIPRIPGMELAARYRAAGEGNEVGGDFYDAFEAAKGAWILTIGDVCGKGPEAAAVTGMARHTIRAVSIHEARPSRVLAVLNETILSELSDDRFCTVCCVRLRPGGDGARLTICSGGHPLPLVLRADGTRETAGEPSMLLGVLPDVELSDHVVDIGPGDTVVMITDGVVEEIRGSDVPGPQRLHEVLGRSRGRSASAIADAIEESLTRFGPQAARDDFAILVLRVKPKGSASAALAEEAG